MEEIKILSLQEFDDFKYRDQIGDIVLSKISQSDQCMDSREMIQIYNESAREYLGEAGIISNEITRKKQCRRAVVAIADFQREKLEKYNFGFPHTIIGINKEIKRLRLEAVRPIELLVASLGSILETIKWEADNKKAILAYSITLGSIIKNICDGLDYLSEGQKNSLDVEVSHGWRRGSDKFVISMEFTNNYLKFIGDDSLEISSIPLERLRIKIYIDMSAALNRIYISKDSKNRTPSYFLRKSMPATLEAIRASIKIEALDRHPYVNGPSPSKNVCLSQYQSPIYEACAEGDMFSMLYNLRMWQSIFLIGRTAPYQNPSNFFMGAPKSLGGVVHRSLGVDSVSCADNYTPSLAECDAIECLLRDSCGRYKKMKA